LQTDGQQSMIFSFGNARTECYDLPASFENPTVASPSRKKTPTSNEERGQQNLLLSRTELLTQVLRVQVEISLG